MQHIVVDLEATCWKDAAHHPDMEIIEIGAVRLGDNLEDTGDEFQSFVRPVVQTQLSDFCTELTTISQSDVDAAETFPEVLAKFIAWIGPDEYRLCSWGDYDRNQFDKDCTRHGIHLPERFVSHHVNVKRQFSLRRNVRRCGVAKALTLLDMPFEGTHHRGIDDARNIARIYQAIMATEEA